MNAIEVNMEFIIGVQECRLTTFIARFVALHSISAAVLNYLWPLENIYLNVHQPKVAHLLTLVSVPFTLFGIWSTLLDMVTPAFSMSLPLFHLLQYISLILISRASSLAGAISNMLLPFCTVYSRSPSLREKALTYGI